MSEIQEKGGYDVEFVGNELNHVTCSICLFVLREPMQAEQCGHRFCRSCIEDVKYSQNGTIVCPEDREIINVFKDKGKEREILNTIVKCTNTKHGCTATKELRELQAHIDVCEFQLIQCPIDGCKEELQRKCWDNHKMERHKNDRINLLERKLEQALEKIEGQERAIENQKTKFELQTQEIKNQAAQLKVFEDKSVNQVFYNSYIWKICQFTRKFGRAQCDRDCKPQVERFFTSKGYRIKAELYLNGRYNLWDQRLSIFFGLEPGPFDDTLKWPMEAVITTLILNDYDIIYYKSIDTNFKK